MAGEDSVTSSTMRKRTLIVKLPMNFEDDLIVLHCEVPQDDPIARFAHIEVTGVLTLGHLTVDEAREAWANDKGLRSLR